MGDDWLCIEGKRAGRAYMASVRDPLDRALWPEYDHHVAVTVDYAAHWRTGLPKPEELTRLQDLEDSLTAHLESHGMLAGSETTDAKRTIHLFVRGGGPLVQMWRDLDATGKKDGVSVALAHDPEWLGVAHLPRAGAAAAS